MRRPFARTGRALLPAVVAVAISSTVTYGAAKTADPSLSPMPRPPAARHRDEPRSAERQRADLLDGLFARLRLAGDDPSATVIAGSIRQLLAKPDSPSAQVLLLQAERALKADQTIIARNLLDLLVKRWPDFAEGWYRRALVRYLENDAKGALADLDRALRLEPRHFEAWMTRGAILQELDRPVEARRAYEAVLTIYPGLRAARDALKELRLKFDQET